MQIDSHYHATYALARAAGLRPEVAQTIATCAQFVDDNVAQTSIELRDGSRVDVEATAHHPIDRENLEAQDQRQVWVPFHFLPGNEGDSFTERLKCRKDSAIAREMVEHHLDLADKPYAASLLGIAAHVYADTFSHYGFAGVSSRGNRVHNDSFELSDDLEPEIRQYILEKQARFRLRQGAQLFDNIKAWLGEAASGALGHGGVATLPDRPYLAWSFEYESLDVVEGKRSRRDNRVTFVEGFARLHDMFTRFAARRPDLCSNDGREFGDIEAAVREVVAVQAPCEGRVLAWEAIARSGRVFGRGGESIPPYQGLLWNDLWLELHGADNGGAISHHAVWRFYQAAAVHRTHVLRDLLPRHGLIVD
jgi:hypothetical protein